MSWLSSSPAGGTRIILTDYPDATIEVMPTGDEAGTLVVGMAVPVPSPNSITVTLSNQQARQLLDKLAETLGTARGAAPSP